LSVAVVNEAPTRADRLAVPTQRTVIAAAARWPSLELTELWKFRELLFFMVWRDVKVRYKQTILGIAWAVMQPAMMMVVFTVFFHRIGKIPTGGMSPELFYLSGLLPWFFFQQSVNAAGVSVIGSEHLITKIYFPRLIIPVSAVFAAVFDSMVALSLLAVMAAVLGVAPSYNIIVLPLIYAIIMMLAIGIGTLIAALNVTYRDVRHIVPFALQLGLFATPSIYISQPQESDSTTLELLADVNPMTTLVSAYRAATVGGPMPWAQLGIAFALALVLLVVGCLYFRKTEDRFADII